ncbi:MAG: hypothetical protein WEA61_01870 [Anaerolineales bacterium]
MRALGALWVLALLVWLPFEDTQICMPIALAVAGCLWLAARTRLVASAWRQTLALGAIFGAACPLLAIGLMALKSGLHGHGFADFTARQVWMIVELLPLSLLLGVLLAIALGWPKSIQRKV